jgi:glucose-6-phosphate isomerase
MSDGLRRLQEERALSQLLSRSGKMARLGSEEGELKLDWVDGVARLLENEEGLQQVEAEAEAIWGRGIRHVIWSGMGGSIMAVRVMNDMGLFGGGSQSMSIHPLDSTDPAALNDVLRALGFSWSAEQAESASSLRDLLSDVMMIAVAMGMTSEEPITHLEWFVGLLEDAGLAPDRHCLVMALPGSFLDRFAQEQGLPTRPLQLDEGTGTGGRMSAPTTRVFLLPAAFALRGTSSGLADVLRVAWAEHRLSSAVSAPAEHPYVRLAATMSDAAVDGVCRLFVDADGGWEALVPWIEQLMEESLGKGSRGVLVFGRDQRNRDGHCHNDGASVHVHIRSDSVQDSGPEYQRTRDVVGDDPSVVPPEGPSSSSLSAVVLGGPDVRAPEDLLSTLATAFLGWQLSMALYGYLQDIQFAGQPAVENYKARARRLRDSADPLLEVSSSAAVVRSGPFVVLAPAGEAHQANASRAIADRIEALRPSYLDVTINGRWPEDTMAGVHEAAQHLGERVLGVPVKIRRAPAAYHSTEQSEMDGPTGVFSIRVLATEQDVPLLGEYDAAFLRAQAVATWQAMVEADRNCYLLVCDGTTAPAAEGVLSLLRDVARQHH